jgi:hypothetical protein
VSGSRPPRLGGRLDYMETMEVHIGKCPVVLDIVPTSNVREGLGNVQGETPRQNTIPGLPEGWRDGEWLITAAAPSIAAPLGQGLCLAVGGLGTADRPLLQAAAEQRLAWATANLKHVDVVPQHSARGLPADLIEEVSRWLPPRAELATRGSARGMSPPGESRSQSSPCDAENHAAGRCSSLDAENHACT